MDPATLDAATIKAILQEQSITLSTRVVALIAAGLLFGVVLECVRRRKLLEEFTPVWMTCALGILALSLSFDGLIWLTDLVGAWTPSSTVFFFGLAFLMAISLGYAIRLSTLSSQVKVLAQELALMQAAQAPPAAGAPGPRQGPG
jgi:hypothetical protein